MISTFAIDEYDVTRPLGLPIDAYVQGVLWLPATSTLLTVPHELLVGDVARWLAAEVDWRVAGPYASLLASTSVDTRLDEVAAICRTLATLDSNDPALPLGIHARVAAGPWRVADAESAAGYIRALQDASCPGGCIPHQEIAWLLDARASYLHLYVGPLLSAHGSYTGPQMRASVVSDECLQVVVGSRRIVEEG